MAIRSFKWCGDRRTVVGREGSVFLGLESGGFFDVPHRVSINKSANYGFHWSRIGKFGGSSDSYAHPSKARWGAAENDLSRPLGACNIGGNSYFFNTPSFMLEVR